MTNEALNKICCEFSGIEPTGSRSIDPDDPLAAQAVVHRVTAVDLSKLTGIERRYAIDVYPPVSTSWEAAGRLMDALAEKGIMAAPSPVRYLVGDRGVKWVARAFDSASQRDTDEMEADSGPMALALAVAALAGEKR